MKKLGEYNCLLFCVTNVFLGQTIGFFGAYIDKYWVMIVGRLIFASGSESLFVVQSFFVEKWFRDQELATALGSSLGIPFCGAYVASNFVVEIATKHGL